MDQNSVRFATDSSDAHTYINNIEFKEKLFTDDEIVYRIYSSLCSSGLLGKPTRKTTFLYDKKTKELVKTPEIKTSSLAQTMVTIYRCSLQGLLQVDNVEFTNGYGS